MAVHVDFSLSWLASSRLPSAHAATLLRLVDAVAKSVSHKQTAKALGVSYRYAWGLLGEAERSFGACLVELERGIVLRGGDCVLASDGRVIEVVAQAERVIHVECDSPQALARAAYHLGNRHVPVQVGEGFLRIAADRVLERMLPYFTEAFGNPS